MAIHPEVIALERARSLLYEGALLYKSPIVPAGTGRDFSEGKHP